MSREPFQDLYQALKERHKHLDSRVPLAWSNKVEDVKRHVWKVGHGGNATNGRTQAHPTIDCFRQTWHFGDNRTLLSLHS